MNTNTKNGTGTTGLIKGIDKYVTQMFGGYKKIEYSGWRNAPNMYRTKNKQPLLTLCNQV